MLTLLSKDTQSLLTVAEAKSQTRTNTSADDTLIADYIACAQEWIEEETGISFFPDVWLETYSTFAVSRYTAQPGWYPYFGPRIELIRYPVQSVMVQYYAGGTLTTMDTEHYTLLNPTFRPAVIVSKA